MAPEETVATQPDRFQVGSIFDPFARRFQPPWSDAAGWDAPQYYATIMTGDVDGDGFDEVLARAANGIHTWKYDGAAGQWRLLAAGDPPLTDATGWNQPQYYATLRLADVNGDGRAELLARAARGVDTWRFDPAARRWTLLSAGSPALTDAAGWSNEIYREILAGDVDGDNCAELVARASDGVYTWRFDPGAAAWRLLAAASPALSDANGWNAARYRTTLRLARLVKDRPAMLLGRGASGVQVWAWSGTAWRLASEGDLPLSDAGSWDLPQYYETIRSGDVDGDGAEELVARAGCGIYTYRFDGRRWTLVAGCSPALSDGNAWNLPQFHSTLRLADVDGDGRAELVARAGDGLRAWRFDRAAWTLLGDAGPFPSARGWDAEKYNATLRTARLIDPKRADVLARGPDGVVSLYYEAAAAAWASFPPLGPIPQPTAENLANVKAKLRAASQWLFEHKVDVVAITQEVYVDMALPRADRGATPAMDLLRATFSALGAAGVPGAGGLSSVLGGVTDFLARDDPYRRRDQIYQDAASRLLAAVDDARTQLGELISDLEESWTRVLSDPAGALRFPVGHLVNVTAVQPSGRDWMALLAVGKRRARRELWRQVLPAMWNDVRLQPGADETWYSTEQEARDHAVRVVAANPNHYLTWRPGMGGPWFAKRMGWIVDSRWLGYGYWLAHVQASASMCERLFQDDGAGNVVRPDAVATRAEVFNTWGLPVQHYVVVRRVPGALGREVRGAGDEDGPARLAGAELSGASLAGARLAGAELTGARLSAARLARAELSDADLSGAELARADLSAARLDGARLGDAALTGAWLDFARAAGADLDAAVLERARGLGLRARGARLAGARAAGAVLRGADLRDADLAGADLTGADLAGADLRGADLTGARLDGATLRGADLAGARLDGAVLEGAETVFAAGLPTPSAAVRARPVRCLAEGAERPPLDRAALAGCASLLARAADVPLRADADALAARFAGEMATLAMFEARPGGLALTFGAGGPDFYRRAAELAREHGASPERAAVVRRLGEAAGFAPLGVRVGLGAADRGLRASVQGPLGLAEAEVLLRIAGAEAASDAIRAAAEALDLRAVVLLGADLAGGETPRVEACFAVAPGDGGRIATAAAALRIDALQAFALADAAARAPGVSCVTVAVPVDGGPAALGVHLPWDTAGDDARAALRLAGGRRLAALEDDERPPVLRLSYGGVRFEPDGAAVPTLHAAFG